MSFYSTPLKSLSYDHLIELVQNRHQENVRLEFKREMVKSDELLKKVSGFANTWGGRIIIGMEQGENSVAHKVCGIPPEPNFESKVTAWCTQDLYPPLMPEVSNPIEIPGSERVAYVLGVEESELAPHFIGGRQGCYVRTNEISRRFEPRLADLAEIEGLLNRREEGRKQADFLRDRTNYRLMNHLMIISRNPVKGPSYINLVVRVAPRFPRRPLVPLSGLEDAVRRCQTGQGHEGLPPLRHLPTAQADSLLFVRSDSVDRPLLEVTTFGTMALSVPLERNDTTPGTDAKIEDSRAHGLPWISMQEVLAQTYLGIKFAKNLTVELGGFGLMEASLEISNARGTAFLSMHGAPEAAMGVAVSYVDNQILLTRQFDRAQFVDKWSEIALEMWQDLYFSLGWKDVYQPGSKQWVERDTTRALQRLRVDASFLR